MNGRLLRVIAGAGVVMALAGSASAQLRVVAWNISNYAGGREAALRTAVYGSFNGLSLSPDIIIAQEILSASAMNTLVSALNTAPGSPGDWAAGPFIDGADTDSVIVFRTSQVTHLQSLVVGLGSSSITNQPRNTLRHDVRPIGYTSAGATLALYNVHMKAGDSSDDQARRLVETQRIRSNASGLDTNPSNGVFDGLPAGYSFLVGGDFNIQTSSQAAYQELVGGAVGSAGRFFDPVATPGSWQNNFNFRFVHTQDPTGPGGVDDRYDIILLSRNLMDNRGFHYVGNYNGVNLLADPSITPYSTSTWNDPNHSYRVWGNDGSSFNAMLTTTGNTMVGPTIAQALRDVATTSGGHLPVFLDLRVPARAGVSATVLDFGTVDQGTPAVTRVLTVTNTGDEARFGVGGIATLNYTLPPASGFSVPVAGYVDAAGGAGVNHTISMPTTTPGVKSAVLNITTDAPDTPTIQVTLQGVVRPPNILPNADAGPDASVTDIDNSGAEPVTLSGALSTDSDGTIVQYRWTTGGVNGTELAPASASPSLSTSLPVGVTTVTLRVTDDRGGVDTDEVIVTVLAGTTGCDSVDFNNDGVFPDDADVQEFVSVLGGGTCATCNDIDFNNDGVFPDDADLSAFLLVLSGGNC